MYRFYVRLDSNIARALIELATDEARDPRDQARLVIRQYLIDIGRLNPVRTSATPGNMEQDHGATDKEIGGDCAKD